MPNPVVTIVIHGAGTTPGEDIVEHVLTSNLAQRSRGLAELGKRGTDMQVVNMTVKYRSGVRIKQMVEVSDALQGEVWRGKIIGIAHRIQGGAFVTSLDVERPNV